MTANRASLQNRQSDPSDDIVVLGGDAENIQIGRQIRLGQRRHHTAGTEDINAEANRLSNRSAENAFASPPVQEISEGIPLG